MNQATQPSEASSAATSAPTEPAKARANILLVDDQPARLLTYEAVLAGLEVDCVRALSGREALKHLLSKEFALILLDVNMPDMDGFETARMIREHPRWERTPIIFVTGVHVSELDRLKGYEIGAIDYIAVPVVPEILRSKVAVLVELHQRRRSLETLNKALAQARADLETRHATMLAERDAQLHAIFEHPTESIVVMQAVRGSNGGIVDWRYRDANTRSLELLGQTREQLLGRCLSEVLPSALAERLLSRCSQVLCSRQAFRYETQFRDIDFLVTLFPMGDECVVSSGVNVTEQKRAEAALRRSEARHRALLENAPVAVAHNALNGRFEYVNRAFCKLVGYTSEELYAKSWQDITHPEDAANDQRLAAGVISGTADGYTIEKRYLRKDGSTVWVNLFGNFVADDVGHPVQGVAVAVDITEQRSAAAALSQSREQLILAKAAAYLGIHDWDVRTNTISWDERTREIWGARPDEQVTYRTFEEGLHPEDRASTQAAVAKALDPAGDGHYFATFRVINRCNGRVHWVEATGRVAFEDRQPVRMVGTVQDVTHRIIARNQLQESEGRFRELANYIDQFAWTCDHTGRTTWYNNRWYEYTGATSSQMQAQDWSQALHPEHFARVTEHFKASLQAGRSWEDTFPLRSKSGDYRWFLSRAVPIKSESGQVLRWFGTNTDVTDLRNLQVALREASARKDEFLAMLSHELRNPAAAIGNAAQALARLTANREKELSLVNIVERQIRQLGRLLDDLLDVSRITQGLIEIVRERTTMQACFDLALETTQPLIRERGHRLVISPGPEPLWIHADKVRLAQCIANLLSNAAKYTESSGEIQIRMFAAGHDAKIEIVDNGVGMPAEFLPHAFELFAQTERPLDRSQGGLGIGLAVCRKLMEMQGGSASAASAGIGQGSTFTLSLPLANEAAGTAQSDTPVNASSVRVLVVDDNRDAADSLALLLQLEDHATLTTYSGADAITHAATFKPQFVLLDIGLPEMDGYEVARRLKDIIPKAHLVAVSGYGLAGDKQRSAEAGFAAHLVKPVSLADIQATFESLSR